MNPHLSSSLRPSLDIARFAGRCVGILIMYKRVLDAALAPAFFKTLMGRRPGLEDLEAVDAELYRALRWMFENNITDVLFETFSIEEETSTGLRVVELIPGGAQIPVTEANKKEYVDARVGHRLIGRVRQELDAFRDGFTGFVPIDLLRRFTEGELAVLSCGLPEITISGWQRRTQIRGYAPDDSVVAWFWDCVRGWDVTRLEKLLFFVTGKTRVPLGSPHERSRLPRAPDVFIIERGGDPGSLPTSHACSSTLYLPPYPSRRVLEKKLLYAIECVLHHLRSMRMCMLISS
ncbi:uncharacterized protein SCHCODRAFT_01176478 [Schizophyllum commune H4-8]|nr:uncharacterized protein SCHCODRAFT_01176478 [Schizophyllum commune H4-8]KAI5885615.1 hypothetical protein SCHCODRAFT_01176478 [Schizophyllum commune H4-8]